MRRTGRVIASVAAGSVLAGGALAGCTATGPSGVGDPPPPAAAPQEVTPAADAPALPTLLGFGLVQTPVEVRTPGPAMYSVRTVVLPPGGTTGWHVHPGTETTAVTAGRVLFERLGGCEPVGYDPGDAVFVPDAVPHVLRNDGAVPAELLVTYLLAPGAPDQFDAPPACPS